MSQLPLEVVRTIYDGVELADARKTLLKLVLVSKAFYAIFSPELYRRIVVMTSDPRIARLVKTLKRNSHLKTNVYALTFRLNDFSARPTTFRRVFGAEEPLDQLAHLGAEGELPNLRSLAFIGERSYHTFTEWTRLSKPVQELFFRMRCLQTIRSLRLECIEELNPAMVWGADGYLALDELRISFVRFYRSPFTQPRPITAPQEDQPHLVSTLSIHSAWMLKLNPSSLFHLESFGFDYLQGATQSEMSDIGATVNVCEDTLRELHVRLPPPKTHAIVYDSDDDTPSEPLFRLDLTRHAKLHTVTITPSSTRTGINVDLKTHLRHAAEKELSAVENCLLDIDLPPALHRLRVRFHLMDWAAVSEGQGMFDVFTEWGLLPRFESLYRAAISPKGGRVEQLEVGIMPVPPLQITCAQLRDLQLRMREYLAHTLEGDPNLDWVKFYLDSYTAPI